jgi:hypothetical protein
MYKVTSVVEGDKNRRVMIEQQVTTQNEFPPWLNQLLECSNQEKLEPSYVKRMVMTEHRFTDDTTLLLL